MQLFCISSKLNTYLRSFLKGHFMNTLNSDIFTRILYMKDGTQFFHVSDLHKNCSKLSWQSFILCF